MYSGTRKIEHGRSSDDSIMGGGSASGSAAWRHLQLPPANEELGDSESDGEGGDGADGLGEDHHGVWRT